MKFVELNRGFLPVKKGQDPELDIGRYWSHKYSGAIFWPELHKYHRVVLLAEASSGKTEEFRNQIAVLRKEGHAAFFVRIEELADEGFEPALDPSDLTTFQAWHRGAVPGWFFLDSLDEARLNRKSFDKALRNIARALDTEANRAHIFVSCRVSDWNGEKDHASIERLLPDFEPGKPISALDPDPLLSPIFDKPKKPKKNTDEDEADRPIPRGLHIFRLTPLITSQTQLLANACGVTDSAKFTEAVFRHQLDMFTERPGDVVDLATYWKKHKAFGSLAAMTEDAIWLKLREEDNHRADNNVLSEKKARQGAELLAAALTLGKTFTLRVPAHDADTDPAIGAVDPDLVLDSWNAAERNALSRRAIFAPATYGRIRFHHRSSRNILRRNGWTEY
jgi:hypothetical protein